MADRYDAIVIGAGVGGLTVATLLAKEGKKVLVLEQTDRVGGRALSVKGEEITKNGVQWYKDLLKTQYTYIAGSEPDMDEIVKKGMLDGYVLDVGYHALSANGAGYMLDFEDLIGGLEDVKRHGGHWGSYYKGKIYRDVAGMNVDPVLRQIAKDERIPYLDFYTDAYKLSDEEIDKLEKVSFKSVHPEWETDELAAPAANIQEEGDDYTFGATTPPTRLGNYTQIMRKEGIISETQEVVDEAGRVQKTRYQKLKKGVELRKDVEYSIVDNNASVAGSTRESGGLPTWIATNVSRGSGGSNGGYNTGTGLTVAATNGTQRAFSKALLDAVMQEGYENGANFRHVFVSPYVKSVFVTFMSDSNVASFRYAASSGKNNSIVANADVYEGPHGKVMIHPNRVMAGSAGLARNVFLVDPEYLQWGWLRKVKEDKEVAKTGDAKKFVLIGEGALKVSNEKGLGCVADIFGLTSST